MGRVEDTQAAVAPTAEGFMVHIQHFSHIAVVQSLGQEASHIHPPIRDCALAALAIHQPPPCSSQAKSQASLTQIEYSAV